MTLLHLALFNATIAQPEQVIEKFLAGNKVPGMFIAVVRGDSVIFQKSIGSADKERGIPLTPSTCMELGSISKVLTAEVIYFLHHAGLLNTHDPIRKYLPNSPASWSKITISQLLSHTSGIRNYLLDPRFHAASYFANDNNMEAARFFTTVNTDSMLRLFYSLPLEFKPGTTWSYSNTGYFLLGKIGEAVTGKPFFELVADIVTNPLQMDQTKANEQAANEDCLAKGYYLKDSLLAPSRVLQTNYAFSAGAWATTGEDMINYLKAVHNKELPSDKAGLDWRNLPSNDDLPFTYNAGRFYTSFHGLKIISHNGGTPGFSSSWIYAVEKNTSIIILMNRQDYAPIDQLAWDVLSSFEPALSYPRQELLGSDEIQVGKKVMALLEAIKSNDSYPHGLEK
ncbi:MAG TPA: serine hydrolase domain-containing protein, partial [Flavisolibacter sp.]